MSNENKQEVKAPEATAPAAEAQAARRVKTEAEMTRTEKFQVALQSAFSEILGKKISRDQAWKLFKESFDTSVNFLVLDAENRLPLSGIGTFEIRKSKPRPPVSGAPSKLAKYETIPHLKFKPSSRYRDFLFAKFGIDPADAAAAEAETASEGDTAPVADAPAAEAQG